MRIAQISPLVESVPPRLYGGTERVVSFLTEALVEMGHEVTLFASGDSVTSAKLVPCVPEALRLNPSVRDHLPYYMVMLKTVREMASKFDILPDGPAPRIFAPAWLEALRRLSGRFRMLFLELPSVMGGFSESVSRPRL